MFHPVKKWPFINFLKFRTQPSKSQTKEFKVMAYRQE